MTVNTSRRGFLKGAAAAGAVLVIGVRPDGALAASGNPSMLTPFVQVGSDGSVTAIIATSGPRISTPLSTVSRAQSRLASNPP